MTVAVPLSERALILAPMGRDSQIALMILNEAGYGGMITPISPRCVRNWNPVPGYC